MGKKITSKIKGWKGTVTIADPLFLPQVLALRKSVIEADKLGGESVFLTIKKKRKLDYKVKDKVLIIFDKDNNEWVLSEKKNPNVVDATIQSIDDLALELTIDSEDPLFEEVLMIQLPAVFGCIEDWNIKGRDKPTVETYPITGTGESYKRSIEFITLLQKEVYALFSVVEEDDPEA